ncbi:MAG: carbohydrate-binding protein [Rhodothermales bacterium]|nr:carbohydrate-binding protein [Rhodothermales bacterium]
MHLKRTFTAFATLLLATTTLAQTQSVGNATYRLGVPSGEVGPRDSSQRNVTPKVSADFAQPVQTSDFWSSLIFPFFGVQHSNVMYAHPLNAKAVAAGLELGYTTTPVFAAQDFLYPFNRQLTVSVEGLQAGRTSTDAYGDWTVTAAWADGAQSLKATLGHGLPFVYFTIEGGAASISAAASPTVWFNEGGVLGITVSGVHYGIFGPAGAEWTTGSTLRSTLADKDYLSVALLPDNSSATMDLFRRHAYAFVTDSRVDWFYDEATSTVETTFSYTTDLKENTGTSADQVLSALYRHQWLNTASQLTGHEYVSPRGTMKLAAGDFSTRHRFAGVLPALPDRGDYNREDLLELVREAAAETLPAGDTYNNGKAMGRFANLVHIADQLGATDERDHFISEIKRRLEDWFTVGGTGQYAYLDEWDVLTGYPSAFGADDQVNDHHFHAAYAIMSAATIAQFDPDWATQENWGGMVNLLIKDANNWDRSDTQFPFLRSHDAYAGHSWAAGHGDFGDGNNQESSSESMNFAAAVLLWGANTGQTEIRDLGVYLHATETAAVEQYWFDVDDAVFPASYPHEAIGMVWGGKGVHSTWFGAHPEFIHGINILPITGGSLYLGRHPDHVSANYAEIVSERGGQPILWKDVLWEYLALADPDLALSHYFADPDYEPFDGESRAHTRHWLYNLKKMGGVDTTTTANTPTYAVFRDGADRTYAAYNAGTAARTVTFSDGFSLEVPARTLASHSTANEDPNAPVVLLQTNRTSGKVPLTVAFTGGRSFDRNDSALSFDWDFAGLGSSSAADTTFRFTEVGEYWVSLTVENAAGLSTRDSVEVTVLGNGTPYSGSAATVPGRIEAERYDRGGEGLAYHDTETANIGLAFRPDEGVDIEGANQGAFDVYWIVAGEWIEYTIQVDRDGLFDILPYVATVPGFGSFRVLIDGEDVSGSKRVTSTGGWQFWRAVPVRNVPMEAGEHILRFEFDSETDKTGWLFSLNWIDVERVSGVSVEEDVPMAFGLGQNFPNPFTTATEIPYELAESGRVKLEVFNVLGQRVSSLMDTHRQPGRHSLSLRGETLPPGVYVYRLTSGDQYTTRRMLRVR